MATAKFHPKTVMQAARDRMASDQLKAVEAHEEYIKTYMDPEKGYEKREGWLWWKTVRPYTREEAVHKHVHGYFPGEDPDWIFGWATERRVKDRLTGNLNHARLLLELAVAASRQSSSNPVTLDRDEVAFLKLGKEQQIDS